MISLHYSNQLEALIDPLASIITAQQRRDPLTPVTIVVPNRVVQEFVKLRLADVTGVAANIDFPFLRRYLSRVATDAADINLNVLESETLELVVFECLRRAIAANDSAFAPVAAY